MKEIFIVRNIVELSILIDGVRKDKKKNKYFKENNLPLLYLWEFDIDKKFDVCEKLIIEFIKSCGILDNYHSMNYFIKDNELILNDNILVPYFER